MEKEREILSEEKAVMGLVLKQSLRKKLGFAVGGAFGGPIVRHYEVKGKLKSLAHIKNLVEGNTGDIDNRYQKGNLILTNDRIILHYQTGFRKKTDKILAFPLQHAKSVEEKGRWTLRKWLQVAFEMPSEEKPINFDLKIYVKNHAQWFTELTRLIQKAHRTRAHSKLQFSGAS